MNRIFYVFSWSAIILSFFIVGITFFWTVFPYRTLEFKGKVFEIVNPNKTIEQGQLLQYKSDYCKYVNLNAFVTRTFTNDLTYASPTELSGRQSGCHTIIVSVVVPLELPPGHYYMHSTFRYQVNPLRTVVVEHDTEYFTVIERIKHSK